MLFYLVRSESWQSGDTHEAVDGCPQALSELLKQVWNHNPSWKTKTKHETNILKVYLVTSILTTTFPTIILTKQQLLLHLQQQYFKEQYFIQQHLQQQLQQPILQQ